MLTLSKARVLAFLQPVISVASGAAAAWLLVHLHVLGIFHTQSEVARAIASGTVFVITSALVWLSTHQRLVPITTAVRAGIAPVQLPIPNVIAFLTPYIATVAGAVAAWLFIHVHLLGFLHLQQGKVTQVISSAIVFAVTAVLTWAAQHLHWLPLKYPPSTLKRV